MQLAGVRIRPKNRLHLVALRRAWELQRKARRSALQAILAIMGKEVSTAISHLQNYFEAETPTVEYLNEKWDEWARGFMKKKGWDRQER